MVSWKALDALSHQLELCRVGPEQRVVIFVNDDVDDDAVHALRAAVTRSGAEAIEARSLGQGSDDVATLHDALTRAADLVITTGNTASSSEITVHGSHIHVLNVAPDAYPPHANLRRRVQRLANALGTGTMLHLHDDNGSDLAIELDGSSISADHGVTTPETPSVVFPSGWVGVQPNANSVNGELVIMPGDATLNADQVVKSPVRLQISNDYITQIDGDSPDADTIRALLEYANEPEAYGFASLTIGMNPGTRPLAAFDHRMRDAALSRLLAGVLTISFGQNLHADRPCRQTITMALAQRSAAVDELPIVEAGVLDGDFAPDVYEA